MKKPFNITKVISRILFSLSLTMLANAAMAELVTFDFTGRLTVFDPLGSVIADTSSAGAIPSSGGLQVAISSTLSFDPTNPLNTSELIIAPFDFVSGTGSPNTFFRQITMESIGRSQLLVNMLADWNGNNGIPISMVWDASGMFGAFSLAPGGLQVGDVISGDQLIRNGNVVVNSIGSANPATNGTFQIGGGFPVILDQGLAPLAVTTLDPTPLCTPSSSVDCMEFAPIGGTPLTDDGIPGSPMVAGVVAGISVAFDIGSGNSMTVVSVVPVPPAVWLFGSGLLGLVGIARRKKGA